MTSPFIQKTALLSLMFWVGLFIVGAKAQTSGTDSGVSSINKSEHNVRQGQKLGAPIVLELFTTADCTACIVADRMLYDSTLKPNVIGLSCQIQDMNTATSDVSKQTTENTTATAPMTGESTVDIGAAGGADPCLFRLWTYTPKQGSNAAKVTVPTFILNGQETVRLNDGTNFASILARYDFTPPNQTQLIETLWKDQQTITLNLPDNQEMQTFKQSASLWLIRYQDILVESKQDGVNAGKVLRFSNVVKDITHIGKWHGIQRTLDISVPKAPGGKEKGGYVILAQEAMGKPVLAVGRLIDYAIEVEPQQGAPSP